MDTVETLTLDRLGISYDQLIHYQWGYILAKRVCTHSGWFDAEV